MHKVVHRGEGAEGTHATGVVDRCTALAAAGSIYGLEMRAAGVAWLFGWPGAPWLPLRRRDIYNQQTLSNFLKGRHHALTMKKRRIA